MSGDVKQVWGEKNRYFLALCVSIAKENGQRYVRRLSFCTGDSTGVKKLPIHCVYVIKNAIIAVAV